ncbi:hypothetical protein J31TS4_05600 [Paenibacillus sp. J31TS4]|uniref:DUF2533 family protein n=1 Tax=Paenibacillus sp. J31TS4 TaxID=2807195 RepID=UPI001B26F348|nr:hypothetical protein J31TS4_05600 [Paenibacillus sp. J31TS4]
MNVHEAISTHSRKQQEHLERFRLLDERREAAIEAAIRQCLAGEAFDTAAINEATAAINTHAKNGISPTRVYVTEDMVREAAAKQRA